MEIDESSFVCNVQGTKRIWEPIKVELKDKVTGVSSESENVWSFIFESNLVAVEYIQTESFIPTIEHLGVK